ncbi:TetR/AcrR family transcriptional regulator [Devosia sp. 2618]|uniref:TetR/AcrR family transcriptional regulator n=1 Tax=Devosia sp. 2618 TaxID=3156454 RepID=UPI003399C06D
MIVKQCNLGRVMAVVIETDGDETPGRSARKRAAILEAATEMFLRTGFLGTNMDEIAARSSVSKQTVYKHFGSKEALFIEIVSAMMGATDSLVHTAPPDPKTREELQRYLLDYGYRQLKVAMTPELMQLRRLVIGEVPRFPDLARVLHERGPQRAINVLAEAFGRLTEQGLLACDDPVVAATTFNWLVMAEPVNRVMLLGNAALPTDVQLQAVTIEATRVFMASYVRAQLGPRTGYAWRTT